MIVITSKREGFRRCGVAHAARSVEWPDERWTGDELAALLAEPMLTVEVVEDPAPVDPDQVPAAPEPYEIVTVEVVEDPAPVDPDQVSAAPEPYEIELDDPDPPPVAKKAGRKK